ncbi:MAG: hypothetical protein KBC07_02535 [Bacteroidales bacterium]|jgi:predicted DNA-binding transcriptional regulator AlpA|nr:hypothetical protein [Bacteroidales bacterium]NLH23651.1 hypothetical protein [Bacteroidales bacterium]
MGHIKNEKRVLRGIPALSEYLGCGYNSAWRIANEGKLPQWKIGKVFCWDADVIDEALASGVNL